ncbi:MAG: serine hydrolase [Chloroflexi bacterium]|nr:serine hydrolase [Chloroflexota bacterium]
MSVSAALEAQDVALRADGGALFAAALVRAAPVGRPADSPGTGVVVLPDARGLHPDDVAVARRFAAAGVDAIVVDHFGRTAGPRDWRQSFEWQAHFALVRSDDVASAVAAAAAYLRSPDGGAAGAVISVGFGFGGTQSLLQAAGGHGLAGVVGVGGWPNPPLPDGAPAPIERVAEFACPVLGLFGWLDPGVSPTWIIAFEQALANAAVPHELAMYRRTGAGFLDRRPDEFPEAAADGWDRVLGFVRALGSGASPRLARYVVVGELGEPPTPTPPASVQAEHPDETPLALSRSKGEQPSPSTGSGRAARAAGTSACSPLAAPTAPTEPHATASSDPAVSVSPPGVVAGTGAAYFPPPEPAGGWRVLGDRREIAARGLDPDRLDELADWMATLQYPAPYPPSPWGLLVVKDGWIVAERYDQPGTRYRPLGIASIGKSLSSLAFGQWLEAGRRGEAAVRLDLDAPVYDRRYLPEGFPLSDPRKAAITFRQVLTHTSGIKPEWDTRGGEGFRFVEYTVGHSALYPDSAPLAFDPGTGYGYSSVAFNHLAVAAPHVTGRHLYEQVRDHILGPIGAESAAWRLPDGEYFGYEDPDGRYMPGSGGPHLTARDLARYAYLHLHRGQWGGRSVVPAWYMDEVRQVVRLSEAQPIDYGLGFGTNDQLGLSADLPRTAVVLSGNGLNIALVVPDWNLVVVRTSRVYWVLDGAAVRRELIRRVLAAIR